MTFKFNFLAPSSSENVNNESESVICEKAPFQREAGELETFEEGLSKTSFETVQLAPDLILKKGLVTGEKASELLKESDLAASDLVVGKYEGGFKLWECGIDLAKYLIDLWDLKEIGQPNSIFPGERALNTQSALELGCGHGLPGIVAARTGMQVHFQDYNIEVLTKLTVPNYACNLGSNPGNWRANGKFPRFFFGGWSSLGKLLTSLGLSETYDYILSSDSIYSLDSQEQLLDCIITGLKTGGKAYLAAKVYYFGVGGSSQGFKDLARKRGVLEVQDVVTIDDGSSNKREIFCLVKI